MITAELRQEFLNTVQDAIELHLPIYLQTAASLHGLEAYYGLHQLKTLLVTVPEFELKARLIRYLKKRWVNIQFTDVQYCHDIEHPLNKVCVSIAKGLQKITGEPWLTLIMASLKMIKPKYYVTSSYEDEGLELHQFLLNEDHVRLMCIEDIIDFAVNDGILKHHSISSRLTQQALSTLEVHKLLSRHPSVQECYEALQDKVNYEFYGETVGAYLNRLIEGLRKGGVKQQGQELDAAALANEAIVAFFQYIESMDSTMMIEFLAFKTIYATNSITRQECSIGDCCDRMSHINTQRKKEADYDSTIFCVELIADDLENILRDNQELFQLTVYREDSLVDLNQLRGCYRNARQNMSTCLAAAKEPFQFYGTEHEEKLMLFLFEKIAKDKCFVLNANILAFVSEKYVDYWHASPNEVQQTMIRCSKEILFRAQQSNCSTLLSSALKLVRPAVALDIQELLGQSAMSGLASNMIRFFRDSKKPRHDSSRQHPRPHF